MPLLDLEGQYAAITTALGIGSENNGQNSKNDTKETLDPNSKNNRAAS